LKQLTITFAFLLLLTAVLAACAVSPTPPTDFATVTAGPSVTSTEVPTPTITPKPAATAVTVSTAVPTKAPAEFGPTGFPTDVNPLTGLKVTDPKILDRRPVIIKVSNLPRSHRPAYGLTYADHIYEYYTEFATTRFSAIFYGRDAEKVRPIRSARMIDAQFLRMYKAFLVYGSATIQVREYFATQDFASRLLMEEYGSCPAICRDDNNNPNTFLISNTGALKDYLATVGKDNSRQNLDGLTFNTAIPAGAKDASKVFVRFSSEVYNRWDFNAATGKYLRFSDNESDPSGKNPVYVPSMDGLTKKQHGADNLIVIMASTVELDPRPSVELLDTNLVGTGKAWIFRDGKMVEGSWKRASNTELLTFVDANGKAIALKPGQTWFQVLTNASTSTAEGSEYRFEWKQEWASGT